MRSADVNFDFKEGGDYASLTLNTPGSASYSRVSEVNPATVRKHVDNDLTLMKTGLRYENIPVIVGNVRGSMKTTKWKGLEGVVVGYHDSDARATLLAKFRKRGKEPRWNQAGILLTIRPTLSMDSLQTVADIPIEFIYHKL